MTEALEQDTRVSLSDLEPKMKFEGEVKAVELYGAFVDFGAEKDGLVHISQISETMVNRVADVLQEGDKVTVWVRRVDPEQGRVALTMIEPPEMEIRDLEPDQVLTGTVTKLVPYGAFVDIGVEREGLVHISEMSDGFVGKPSDVMEVGAEIEVRVVKVNQKRRRIELSLLNTADEAKEDILDKRTKRKLLRPWGWPCRTQCSSKGCRSMCLRGARVVVVASPTFAASKHRSLHGRSKARKTSLRLFCGSGRRRQVASFDQICDARCVVQLILGDIQIDGMIAYDGNDLAATADQFGSQFAA
jgi:transcriptional accessory protein Tex/SPT6